MRVKSDLKMPPSQTNLPNHVGPLQTFPFETAMNYCRDLSLQNTYYIYNEGKCKLDRLLIDPLDLVEMKIARELYDGVRVIVYDGISYTVMAMSKKITDTPEKAYDRAMGVIGKR